ncbi:hypothetical protein [Anaerotignum faecicola]
MNKIPIDSKYFEEYIQRNALFERAQTCLAAYLKDWYEDSPDSFVSDMRVPFQKVMETYDFQNKVVAINKNFFYEPPQDYLSVCISILDDEGSYVCQYLVFFDFSFGVIDDKLTR